MTSAFSVRFLSMLMASVIALPVLADPKYPDRPVRMIVPTTAGGPTDYVARLLAQQLTTSLGQTVVVQNVPGASGAIGTGEVVRAKKDGYTLLFSLNTAITLVPNITTKPTYDVKRDLLPVAQVARTPLVLYTNSDVPVKDFTGFVELARKEQGRISYGFPGVGSSFNLLGEYLGTQLGLQLVAAPYKGAAPMINDLLAGTITAGINDIGVTAQYVKSGQLRALAATGAARSAAAPNIPTFLELGIVGTEQFSPWWGVFLPAGTPDAIVAKLSSEIVQILKQPAISSRLLDSGYEVTALSPSRTSAAIDAELAGWRQVLSALGNPKFD